MPYVIVLKPSAPPPVVTLYTLTPASMSGASGIASANWTVTLGFGTLAGTVVITPADGGAGGTFTPSTVSLTNTTRSATFTYTAAGAGTITISTTNNSTLTNPASATYTATVAATTYTLTPATMSGIQGSASANWTVTLGAGTQAGTVVVTPADAGAGGTFTPTTVSLTNSTRSATFTYTAVVTGSITISVTNNGGLTNPASAAYTSSNLVTTYTLAPATMSGSQGSPSANWTVTLGAGSLGVGTVVITPNDTSAGGSFTPSTISLTNTTRSGTFTYTAITTGSLTIAVTNNGGLTNPSSATYTSTNVVSSYTLSPASMSGVPNSPSANWTVTLNSGTLAGTVIITPADNSAGGFFTPATVSLTNATRSATFTYTSVTNGTITISVANNGGLINPPSATYTSGPPPATVNIDSTWLAANGPAPYLLTMSSKTYTLQTDVTVAGTAFAVLSSGITLDLNSHTIIYDNTTPLVVINGGFDTGDFTGWDTSAAPGALVQAARVGMFGPWMCHLNIPINTTQWITSTAIAIPTANIEYAASVVPRCGDYQTTVTISVIDSVTLSVLASASSPNANAGCVPVATFVPTTTHSVQIRVTVAPIAGNTDYCDLDYVALTPSRNYGVVASPDYWYFPAALAARTGTSINPTGFTLKNGTIHQGQAKGYASWAVDMIDSNQVTIDHVSMQTAGLDCQMITGSYAKNFTITNNTLNGQLDHITNRKAIIAHIKLDNITGTANVQNNIMTGSGQAGVHVDGGGSLTLNGNTITMTALTTDGYALFCADLQNFEMAFNTVNQTSGRGIICDSYNGSSNYVRNGSIHDNTIQVQESPNLEVGATGMEATALRLRNLSGTDQNIQIYNNSFTATTSTNQDWTAIGCRITQGNAAGLMDNCNVTLTNNLFKGIVNSSNGLGSPYTSNGIGLSISQFDIHTGMLFSGNTFESNATSLAIGDNDSYGTNNQDITFVNNIHKKSSSGISLTYHSIVAGNWNNGCSNMRMIDPTYTNGATASLLFNNTLDNGTQTKDVRFGALVGLLNVTNPDTTASNGATVTISSSDVTATGTVTNAVSKIVTGSGTSFLTQVAPGSFVKFSNDGTATWYLVNTVDSNTSLTLFATYTGTTGAGVTLTVRYSSNDSRATGSITNAASTAVVGSGTAFLAQVAVGSYVQFYNDPTYTWYLVDAVASNTALTLHTSYSGSTGSSNVEMYIRTAATAAVQFTGTTSAAGQITNIPLVNQIVSQTGVNAAATATLGTYSITAVLGIHNKTQTFSLVDAMTLNVQLV